jgi:predicted NAD/FAD-binding protein/DUF1365 family protein
MEDSTSRVDAPHRRHVVVIGSGVAGLVAAHVAARSAQVTLIEADQRLGGHADTHRVVEPDGTELAIDTGFIVHNERTYPVLLRLFRELGVDTQPSEMSMSVSDEATGLEYAGALGARGLFPTLRNAASPAYLRMLGEVTRFHRRARALLARTDDQQTFAEFLADGRFSAYFQRHFAEPLVAAVWSCDPEVALEYPARYLFRFLDHHGMLAVFGSPQWKTVAGGSREYVARVAAGLPEVLLGTKVTSVLETPTGVEVTDGNGVLRSYDAAVIATHPDQALSLLADPTPLQRELLSAMPYSANTAHLHTDTSLLPQARAAWASWNFLRPQHHQGEVTVTYDLTRLMRLPTDTHYLVTLGGTDRIDPAKVIDTMEYAHPLYTPSSVAAQARLPEIDSDRIAFAGAYHGWGFHEDGARSGLRAAERLGFDWGPEAGTGASRPALPATPVLYDATISHTRRAPFRRSFTHRNLTWLVDLDHLPDHGLLGRFEARDHLGDPGRSLRDNVDAFLAGHGIDLTGGRVLMAANARAFGYCFNPISVHWCFDRDRELAAVVVEVHNTYGDRHAYLVHPDAQGRARTDKQMYVSPFHGVDGHYDLAVPVPGDRLRIAVTLHTEDGDSGRQVFSALLAGRRPTPAGRIGVARAAPAALAGSLLIRAHGIWLWARRLPIRPRPAHSRQEGV